MQKLDPDTEFKLFLPPQEITFAGEHEDFEEIAGNLLENAMKWSSGVVTARLARKASASTTDPAFELFVEDDGPGIPEDKARLALKRGRRLDESKPGSGLGAFHRFGIGRGVWRRFAAGAFGTRRIEGRCDTSSRVTLKPPCGIFWRAGLNSVKSGF